MGLFTHRTNSRVDPNYNSNGNQYGRNPDNLNDQSGMTDRAGTHHRSASPNNNYDTETGTTGRDHHHHTASSNDKYNTNTRITGRGRHYEKHSTRRREKRALFDMDSGYYNRRPTFGQWLKFSWIDILTMIAMGAVGLGIYEAHPAPSRSFPITFQDGEVVYPQFAYPLRKEIVPIWLAALLGSLIPIFIILCMQIRIRSFWDMNNAIMGLFYSLITAAVFQVFLKWLIGGLRPHFLSVCDPDPALIDSGGTGFQSVMFQRDVCRGNSDQIDDSLESFPSGHSTAAFAGFGFLYFYLNAKLKVFSNHHPAMWKLLALYAPILGATLIAGALTIDEFHNWYDCLAGAIIGSVMAISSYRMVYASVWDFRFNHIPLTRHTPFSYGAGEAGAGGFESAVFTRRAGWGFEEAYGGAPFDAAHGMRGQMIGFNQGAPGRHGGAGILGNRRNDDVEHNTVGTAGYDHGHNQYGNNATSSNHSGSGGGVLGGILGGHRNGNQNSTTSPNILREDAVTTNRDGTYANEPTTPIRDGRYHYHNRSLERKAIPNPNINTNAGTTGNQHVRPAGDY